MTILATTRTPSLLPPARDLAAWHAAITAEVTQHLTAAHAALLARPEPGPTGVNWIAPDGPWRRHGDLPADDREALFAAVASIRSDVRRLAQSGLAPAVSGAWPLAWTIPDLSHLYAVDGRPVLTGWSLPAPGGAPGAALDRLDDGVPFVPSPRTPWRIYGLTGALLAVIALTAGLVLPFLGISFATPPAMCTANPAQLALLRAQAAADDKGSQLRATLAALTEEMGRRQLLCPLRGAPRPATATPAPTPPPPRAALPQDRWERRDLTLLEGCWNLTSEVQIVSRDGHSEAAALWKMCFDRAGVGKQTEAATNRSCTGPLAAAFSGDVLVITMPARCSGELNMVIAELKCRRVGDAQADCVVRNNEAVGDVGEGTTYNATFKR